MNRSLVTAALLLAGLLGITACASEKSDKESANSSATATKEPVAKGSEAKSVMPQGAKPGSADFPFPVPQDWTELEPFTEGKLGKDISMAASFGFPEDAISAAEAYQRLLEEAGFEIHPNPLGEQVNDAAFIAKGKVNGANYSGTLDFDADADGTQRVAINLTKD